MLKCGYETTPSQLLREADVSGLCEWLGITDLSDWNIKLQQKCHYLSWFLISFCSFRLV